MAIIENKIAFPKKFGKIMGMILIFGIPYILQHYILYPELLWLAPPIWLLSCFLSIVYVYFWIKADEINSDEKIMKESLQETNQIFREYNEIIKNKPYFERSNPFI